MTHGLLPSGLRDRLAPEAAALDALQRLAMDRIAARGYLRVQPPLAEFEDGLAERLKGAGKSEMFRAVDPVSAKTLAMRPDITAQISRIATAQLGGAARPLRLTYAGQVLKLRATMLRPERELTQIGAEIIGNDGEPAAIEAITLALDILTTLGVEGLAVDLTLPDLVTHLAQGPLPIAADRIDAVRTALDAKDVAALTALGAENFLPLLRAAGPLPAALDALAALNLPLIETRLDAIRSITTALDGKARLMLDPGERHGFEYQTWLGFSLFGSGVSGEIGRGGSYTIVHADGREEAAIGFSLYLDPLIDAGSGQAKTKRLFLPLDTTGHEAASLRAEGWITVAALSAHDDPAALACTHILTANGPKALAD